jgi:hypothetical protein
MFKNVKRNFLLLAVLSISVSSAMEKTALSNEEAHDSVISLEQAQAFMHAICSKITNLCAYCCKVETAGESFKKCVRCMSLYYCGKECQSKHWKNGHQEQCPIKASQEEKQKAKARILVHIEKCNREHDQIALENNREFIRLILGSGASSAREEPTQMATRIDQIGVIAYEHQLLEEIIAAKKLGNQRLFEVLMTKTVALRMIMGSQYSDCIKNFQRVFFAQAFYPARCAGIILGEVVTPGVAINEPLEVLEWTRARGKKCGDKGYSSPVIDVLELLRRRIMNFLAKAAVEDKANVPALKISVFAGLYELACRIPCIKAEKSSAFVKAVKEDNICNALRCLDFHSIIRSLLKIPQASLHGLPHALIQAHLDAGTFSNLDLSEERGESLYAFIVDSLESSMKNAKFAVTPMSFLKPNAQLALDAFYFFSKTPYTTESEEKEAH